jgi:DNA polymerase-3 subunit delta
MIVSKATDVAGFLKAPPAHIRVVLVYGPDRARVRERCDIIAKHKLANPDDPFSSARLNLAELDSQLSTLEDELTAMSLLGDKRLVRLRVESEGRVGPQLAAIITQHAEGAFNPDTLLLIEAESLGKDSKARSAAEKAAGAAALPCYEADARDIATRVRQTLQTAGVRLAPDALEALLSRLPPDMGLVDAELEKLTLFARPGEEISRAHIDALMAGGGEGDVFDAAFEAFNGQAKQAHRNLSRALEAGEHPATAVRALSMHALRLRRAEAHMTDGKSAEAAAKSVGIFWKQEQAFLSQISAWPLPKLRGVMTEVRAAEVQTKSTGQPAERVLERLVISLAARAKRL